MATKKTADESAEPAKSKAPIHPHGDEALAAMEREQAASQKANREAEDAENARRIEAVTDGTIPRETA